MGIHYGISGEANSASGAEDLTPEWESAIQGSHYSRWHDACQETSADLQWRAPEWNSPAAAFELLAHWESVQDLIRVKRAVDATPDPVWNVVAELGQQLREQQRQLVAQQRQLVEQQKELAELKSQLKKAMVGPQPVVPMGRPPPAVPDEALRWMMKNRELVAQYRGKRIAVHPARGIVASADSYTRLHELLQQQGLLDEVVIEFVSPAFPSK